MRKTAVRSLQLRIIMTAVLDYSHMAFVDRVYEQRGL